MKIWKEAGDVQVYDWGTEESHENCQDCQCPGLYSKGGTFCRQNCAATVSCSVRRVVVFYTLHEGMIPGDVGEEYQLGPEYVGSMSLRNVDVKTI
jgi:hypothetical protein